MASTKRTSDIERKMAARLVYLSEPFRPYELHDDTLDSVLYGLLNDRLLHVVHQARSGERTYVAQPLALVMYRRGLYLFASVQGSDGYRRLPIERLTIERTGKRVRYPRKLDVAAEIARSFGIFDLGEPEEVIMRFEPGVSELVLARQWHPSQTLEQLPDGRVELRMFTCGPELGRLALEFGDQVEVIAPAGLRERVRGELTRALARYADT